MPIFFELTAVLVLATVVSAVMRFLKQPLIVGYILTGILVGPSVLNLVHSHEVVETFAKLGISILLFIVGLHLSPRVIKEVGSVSLVTGIGQVLVTSMVGFGLSIFLGIDRLAALYVAIALTFSSTIIVLKLLSDKGDVQSLYGKIAIGFLLVQDLIATVILIVISSVSVAETGNLGLVVGLTLLKGLGLLVGILAVTRWLLPPLLDSFAKSQELLFLFSLAWGFGLATIFQLAGLSVEIGALIAGVALSTTAFAEEMSSRLKPLRDFFIILFFIVLGSNLTLSLTPQILIPTLVFSVYVLIGNPVIMIILMNLLGYHRKTSFMAGLTVAQISEFSLILASLGMQVGHLSPEVLTIVTLVGMVTIAGSTYLILYSDRLYPLLTRLLQLLELRQVQQSGKNKQIAHDAYLFGFNRVGRELLEHFRRQGYSVGVVDFDPGAPARLPKNFKHFYYGDAANVEFLSELPLAKTKVVISTVPNLDTNMLLLKFFAQHRPSAISIIFAPTRGDAVCLYEAGASYVVLPHELGAQHTIGLLSKFGFNRKSFERKRQAHTRSLNEAIIRVK